MLCSVTTVLSFIVETVFDVHFLSLHDKYEDVKTGVWFVVSGPCIFTIAFPVRTFYFRSAYGTNTRKFPSQRLLTTLSQSCAAENGKFLSQRWLTLQH